MHNWWCICLSLLCTLHIMSSLISSISALGLRPKMAATDHLRPQGLRSRTDVWEYKNLDQPMVNVPYQVEHHSDEQNLDDGVHLSESIVLQEGGLRDEEISEEVKDYRESSDCEVDDFNFTYAAEMGRRFQAEFCPLICRGNNSQISGCMTSYPSCVECFCDEECDDYGDCCMSSPSSVEENFESEDVKTNRLYNVEDGDVMDKKYSCVIINQGVAIFIVTSCPDKGYVFTGGEILNNDNDVTLMAKDALEVSGCEACLAMPDSRAYMTSVTSGVTYCNRDCLRCNEGSSSKSEDIIVWETETICNPRQTEENSFKNLTSTSLPESSKSFSMSGCADLSAFTNDTHECHSVPVQPPSVSVRRCDTHLVDRGPLVDTCVSDLSQQLNIGPDVARKVVELCSAYKSPVYTDDAVYRNIFCYMCQGKVPVICPPLVQYDVGSSSTIEITLTLLTDISDDDDADDDDSINGNDAAYLNLKEASKNDANFTPTLCDLGFWAEPYQHDCMQIYCDDGRNLTLDPVSKAFRCDLDPTLTSWVGTPELYVLDLLWYVYAANVSSAHSDSKHKHHVIVDTEVDAGTRKTMDSLPGKTVRPTESSVHPCEKYPGGVLPATGFTALGQRSDRNSVTQRRSTNTTHFHRITSDNVKDFVTEYVGHVLQTLNVTEFLFQHRDVREQEIIYRSHSALTFEMRTAVSFSFSSSWNRRHLEKKLRTSFNKDDSTTIRGLQVTFSVVQAKTSSSYPVALKEKLYFSRASDGSCCEEMINSKTLYENPILRRLACQIGTPRVTHFSGVTACAHVAFNSSYFNTSQRHSLVGRYSRLKLKRTEYVLDEDLVLVCVDTLQLHTGQRSVRTVSLLLRLESILTIVVLPLSMTCLLLTLMTYSAFPLLRSLPGKNNMVLVSWLFLAQGLLLMTSIPEKRTVGCAVLGIFLHLAWLFSIIWTSVCSFHMFHVFVLHRIAPRHHQSHRWYLSRYLIVCSSTVVLVIASVVGSSMYLSDGTTVGYGARQCYLNSKLLVGLAFFLPLSLVLLLNFAFFTLTLITISKIDDVKRQEGRGRRNVYIYIRLSSLTGLCWFLALLAEIPQLHFLRIVSVLLNGSQGVMLFLSYACNRRSARMWRRLLKPRSPDLARNLTYSTHPVTLSTSV